MKYNSSRDDENKGWAHFVENALSGLKKELLKYKLERLFISAIINIPQ